MVVHSVPLKSGVVLAFGLSVIGSFGMGCFLIAFPLANTTAAFTGPCDSSIPSGSSGVTESLPPESIGDNCVAIQVIAHPTFISVDNNAPQQSQNVSLTLRLYSPFNNQTYSHITSRITITHVNDNKTVFDDTFHSHSGLLTLDFLNNRHGNDSNYQRMSELQNAILAPQSGIEFTSVFGAPGLYHIQVQALGLNKDELLKSSDQNAFFSGLLTVRSVYNNTISSDNHNYNVTAFSYYDMLNDFGFDPRSKTFHFSMPFNWDATFIKNNNIFVHEELLIPKSFSDLLNDTNLSPIIFEQPPFNATVNGIPVKGRNLAIDPYTYPDYVTFHYLLNKNDLASMPQEMHLMNMTLSLHPIIKTTNQIETDTGGIMVNLDWTQEQPQGLNNNWTVSIDFVDGFSGRQLDGDVHYDLLVLDRNKNPIYSRSNLVAQDGRDTQNIGFPKNGTNYAVEVKVNGLSHDVDSTVDHARNGTAKGVVVVPEFSPFAIMTIVIVLFIAMSAMQRFRY